MRRHARREFYERVAEIAKNPLPGDGDIFPLKHENKPLAYTASFGDGMIAYQAFEEPEWIVRLFDVYPFWEEY
jgi:hypothetical protein